MPNEIPDDVQADMQAHPLPGPEDLLADRPQERRKMSAEQVRAALPRWARDLQEAAQMEINSCAAFPPEETYDPLDAKDTVRLCGALLEALGDLKQASDGFDVLSQQYLARAEKAEADAREEHEQRGILHREAERRKGADMKLYIEELAGVVALPDHMDDSLFGFARRLRLSIEDEQAAVAPDTALIGVLCDAARVGWELGRLAGIRDERGASDETSECQ